MAAVRVGQLGERRAAILGGRAADGPRASRSLASGSPPSRVAEYVARRLAGREVLEVAAAAASWSEARVTEVA